MSPPYGWRVSPHRSLARDDLAEEQGERPPLPPRRRDRLVRLDQLLHRRGLRPAQQDALRMVLVAVRIGTAWLGYGGVRSSARNSKAPGQRLADRAACGLVRVAMDGGSLTLLV